MKPLASARLTPVLALAAGISSFALVAAELPRENPFACMLARIRADGTVRAEGYTTPGGPVQALTLAPDGRLVAVGGLDELAGVCVFPTVRTGR